MGKLFEPNDTYYIGSNFAWESCSEMSNFYMRPSQIWSKLLTKNNLLEGFHDSVEIGIQVKRPVFISETGEKPLIVLHELPGMSESFVEYCRKMSKEGFKVYMPLIFKSPGTRMNTGQSIAFCMTKEFRDLFSAVSRTETRPFTAWLLELVQNVADRHSGAKIGLVGMCLTGGFAIASVAKPQVHAVAACQPSFPFFFNIKTLGLSKSDRERIEAGTIDKVLPCVKAYRYSGDMICRESHMKAARKILRNALERYSPDLPGKAHSTLTSESANPEVYHDVLEFLNKRI